MAENKDTSTQANIPVQAAQNSSIQEVQTGNHPSQEGYQPLVRKGYQPTETPLRQSPPQSISGIFPFVETPPPNQGAASVPPTTSTQSQNTGGGSTENAQKGQ